MWGLPTLEAEPSLFHVSVRFPWSWMSFPNESPGGFLPVHRPMAFPERYSEGIQSKGGCRRQHQGHSRAQLLTSSSTFASYSVPRASVPSATAWSGCKITRTLWTCCKRSGRSWRDLRITWIRGDSPAVWLGFPSVPHTSQQLNGDKNSSEVDELKEAMCFKCSARKCR